MCFALEVGAILYVFFGGKREKKPRDGQLGINCQIIVHDDLNDRNMSQI